MSKYLFIGDIHGDLKLVQFLLGNFSQYQLCFVGDIMDSFKFTPRDQVECMRLILSSDCGLIRGNHEESYLYQHMRASGWNPETDYLLQPYYDAIKARSKYFLYLKDHQLLVTHAGLSKGLWDNVGLTLDKVEETLTTWSSTPVESPIHWIGQSRGGRRPCSGILWCDYNLDFEPVEGLKQVFGHTLWIDIHKDAARDGITNGIRSIGNNYNIDCLQSEYTFLEFDTETGLFTDITIPEENVKNFHIAT